MPALQEGAKLMNFKRTGINILLIATLSGAPMLLPQTGQAQDERILTAMELLESMASKLGAPRIEGTDAVAGKEVPAIYFGSTKMNNNFELVDEVVKQAQGTATIFVKNSDEYVRVATNVKYGPSGLLKDDILSGANAHVFASANMQHPEALHDQKRSGPVVRFEPATNYVHWSSPDLPSTARTCSIACSIRT
jgi:hypothetical protein